MNNKKLYNNKVLKDNLNYNAKNGGGFFCEDRYTYTFS